MEWQSVRPTLAFMMRHVSQALATRFRLYLGVSVFGDSGI